MALTLYRAGSIVSEKHLYGASHAQTFDDSSGKFGMKDSRRTSVYASTHAEPMENRWAAHRRSQELDECMFRIVIPDEFVGSVFAYEIDPYEMWCSWRTVYEDDAPTTLSFVREYAHSRVPAAHVTERAASRYEVLIPRLVALQSEWLPYECVDGCEHQEVFAAGGGFLFGVELEELVELVEARTAHEEAEAASNLEREYRELFESPALVGVSD